MFVVTIFEEVFGEAMSGECGGEVQVVVCK
jgi:hypothetical protein